VTRCARPARVSRLSSSEALQSPVVIFVWCRVEHLPKDVCVSVSLSRIDIFETKRLDSLSLERRDHCRSTMNQ
jgi:hypothetical protein